MVDVEVKKANINTHTFAENVLDLGERPSRKTCICLSTKYASFSHIENLLPLFTYRKRESSSAPICNPPQVDSGCHFLRRYDMR